jgi:hypothetical protein
MQGAGCRGQGILTCTLPPNPAPRILTLFHHRRGHAVLEVRAEDGWLLYGETEKIGTSQAIADNDAARVARYKHLLPK